jgi:hypothetical protein
MVVGSRAEAEVLRSAGVALEASYAERAPDVSLQVAVAATDKEVDFLQRLVWASEGGFEGARDVVLVDMRGQ